MILLDYTFDPEALQKLQQLDCSKVTATELDYYLFCGDIIFRVDGVVLDALWKWIPLFDFCVRINEAVAQLEKENQAVLEFTENEATIVFQKENDLIHIRADYANADACVRFREVLEAVKAFSGKLCREILGRWPMLLSNEAFRQRLEIIRSVSGSGVVL